MMTAPPTTMTTAPIGYTRNGIDPRFFLVLAVLDCIVSTGTTLGNLALLVTIYRDPLRRLRKPSSLLIANLGVADLLLGAVVGYSRAVEELYLVLWNEIPIILNITGYLVGSVSLFAGVCTLMVMSWERYVAVADPFGYPSRVTDRRTKLYICFIWMNAIGLSFLPLTSVEKAIFLLTYCYSHFALPLVAMSFLYTKLFKTMRCLREEFKQVRTTLSVENARKIFERESKMLSTIVLVLALFFLSFLPFFIKVHVLFFCSCKNSAAYVIYHYVANEFLPINSLANPFLYAWRLPKYRRSLVASLKCKRNSVGVSR